MSRRAGATGRAAGSVRTQHEEGELSSRGNHLTGGGRQALQPPALPEVPEWRSGAAVRGKKAPARQGQPPARAGGGRTARLCWHSPSRAAGRAEMGRRLPSPPPLGYQARRTTFAPRLGDPSRGTGLGVERGWGWSRGGDTARTVPGGAGRGGAARPGNIRVRGASRAPRPRKRQEAPDFRHHPRTSSSLRSPSGRAQWPLLRSRRGSGAALASVTCANGSCRGLSRARHWDSTRNGTCELHLPLPRLDPRKVLPRIERRICSTRFPTCAPIRENTGFSGRLPREHSHPTFSGGTLLRSSGLRASGRMLIMKMGLCCGAPGYPSPPVPPAHSTPSRHRQLRPRTR